MTSVAGCFGDQSSSEAPSPTPGRTASPSAHQEETAAEQTDSETKSSDSATEHEGSETPHETTDEASSTGESTEEQTRTPDCTYNDIEVKNRTSQTVSVSLRIVEGWDNGDEEEDSVVSTPTPTPTPNEVFSDSFRLGSGEWQTYDDIPDRDGRYRLHIDVENGPNATERVHASDWEDNYFIQVYIEADAIRFKYGHSDPPRGC